MRPVLVVLLLLGLSGCASAAAEPERRDPFCTAYLRWEGLRISADGGAGAVPTGAAAALAGSDVIARAAAPAELREDMRLLGEADERARRGDGAPGADPAPARARIDSWVGVRCGWPTAHVLVDGEGIVGLEHDLPAGPITLVVRSRAGDRSLRLTRADDTARTLAAVTVGDARPAVVHLDLRPGTHTLRFAGDGGPALVIVR